MPYPLPPNSIIELTYSGVLFGQAIRLVHHYRYDQVTPHPNGASALDLFLTAVDGTAGGDLMGKIQGATSPDCVYTEVSAQYVYVDRFAKRRHVLNKPGLLVGDSLPSNECAVITLGTDRANIRHGAPQRRGAVGNKHLAGVPRAKVTADQLDAYYRDVLLGAIGQALIDTVVDSGGFNWKPVLWHRGNAITPYDDVTTFVPQPDIRTLRRRTFQRGI